MNPSSINWLAAVVAGLFSFMAGGLWYSRPVFANTWMTDSKLTETDVKQGNKGKIFGFTAIFSLLMAVNQSMFLADSPAHITDMKWGATAGFFAGIRTFCAISIHSLFELKSWQHIFINSRYRVVSLTLMGVIIGL